MYIYHTIYSIWLFIFISTYILYFDLILPPLPSPDPPTADDLN